MKEKTVWTAGEIYNKVNNNFHRNNWDDKREQFLISKFIPLSTHKEILGKLRKRILEKIIYADEEEIIVKEFDAILKEE